MSLQITDMRQTQVKECNLHVDILNAPPETLQMALKV